MFIEYARLVRRRYLSAGPDLTSTTTLEEQDALTRPASLITSATMADVDIAVGCLLSSPAVLDTEANWTVGDLVAIDAEERVGEKRRLCDLEKSCRVEMQKVPGSVV